MKHFSVKCHTKGCRYSRSYGAAPLTADTKAAAHSLRKGHKTEVIETDLIRLENYSKVIYDHSESRPASQKVTEEIFSVSACRPAAPPF